MALDLHPPDEVARAYRHPVPPRVGAVWVGVRRAVATLAVVVPVAWALARATTSGNAIVNPGGLPQLQQLMGAVLHPATSPEFLRVVVDASLVTVTYAALGTAGALLLGAVGAVVLSDVAWRDRPGPVLRLARFVLRGVLVAARSVHELIWALLFVSVLGIDPLVAVLAIAVPFGAQTAKVFAQILDGVDRHPMTAMRAGGARTLPALAYGLVPQAAPLLLSYAFYRFECAIRSSVILGVVGVGGLGQELVVSLQSRTWDEVWTLIAAVLVLSAVVDVWSSRVRADLAVMSCSDWSGGTTTAATANRSLWARWSAVVAVVGVVAAAITSGVSLSGLTSSRTRELTGQLVHDLLPPALPPGGWSTLGGATLDTVAMAVLAMALAVALTVAVGPFATRVRPSRSWVDGSPSVTAWGRLTRAVARLLARALLLVLRSIPPTVWAVLALLVLFPGILPGAIALGLYTAGILGRLVAEAWESVDTRPRDALAAAGVPPGIASVAAVLPPSAFHMLAYTLYRFEICVRDTAVVGVVGAAGLGRLFAENLAVFRFPAVTTLLITSFVVSAASEVVGRRVRRAVNA
jgi:phosphonate transport system permease protein